jgi:hypothetical protein
MPYADLPCVGVEFEVVWVEVVRTGAACAPASIARQQAYNDANGSRPQRAGDTNPDAGHEKEEKADPAQEAIFKRHH